MSYIYLNLWLERLRLSELNKINRSVLLCKQIKENITKERGIGVIV